MARSKTSKAPKAPTRPIIQPFALSRCLAMKNKKNPKAHKIEDLIESFVRFGFKAFPTIDEATMIMVAGHGRCLALEQMRAGGMSPPAGITVHNGEWLVPIIRGLSFANEQERDAYMVADNAHTISGGWDLSVLTDVMRELEPIGFEGMGFSEDSLEDLLGDDDDEDGDPGPQVTGGGKEVDVDAHTRVISGQEIDVDPDDDTGPQIRIGPDPAPPFRQLTEFDLMQAIARLDPEARKRIVKAAKVNPKGGSGDEDRGTWCTSREWAIAVGPWDLDPFTNPRSHIASVARCMLEDGGDAFGGSRPGEKPGLYLTGNAHGAVPTIGVADELTRVWIQPPYELVAAAIAHYGHTRFCALLRWSPDVKAWFPGLWRRTAVVCHPYGDRMDFEPPPGIDKSGDMPFPHALYYAHESDVTDAVRARCIIWRINHDLDDARSAQTSIHLRRADDETEDDNGQAGNPDAQPSEITV